MKEKNIRTELESNLDVDNSISYQENDKEITNSYSSDPKNKMNLKYSTIVINSYLFFAEEEPDDRICEECGKLILDKAYVPIFKVDFGKPTESSFSEIGFALCKICSIEIIRYQNQLSSSNKSILI